MKIEISGFNDGEPIPADYAFGVPADIGHIAFGPNCNPHVRWSGVPEGTRSFALILHDEAVPSIGDDVNREGRTVPWDLPRVDFFHWVLVDIPAHIREIPEGAMSTGVTAKGKPFGPGPYGVSGINDYTGWFAGDPEMAGNYGGYDGPCPPWNDKRVHVYHFTIYALNVETLGLAGAFTGGDARAAIEGHVVAQAEQTGIYTINPSARL
ncbi:MAG TPA: YbhB/YbcL family Raf kinase inhibitor-like protein [Anaerolineales bacterium]|nr:YbhB/YbcL family Raf kinase inhibitor-like protein [Anaerolineales bacterium]